MSGSRQIVVVRALYLGDLLCAVPAFRAIRCGEPDAEITLIGLPWARVFADRLSDYIDRFEEFPGFPGLPEVPIDASRVTSFLERLQARDVDLAIQLHGSGSHINAFLALLGAKRCAGFYRDGDVITSDGCFVPWPAKGSEVDRLLAIPRALGYPVEDRTLEFPVTPSDVAASTTILPDGPYACIHAGARWSSRRWPPRRFAAVADAISSRGLRIVLTGSGDEAAITTAVRAHMKSVPVDVTGRTSLGALAAVIRGAALLVCNDTGVSHLAAAVGTPSIVISSGSDATRWAPAGRGRHRVLWRNVPCRPCMHEVCPTDHECAKRVSVDEVVELSRDMA